MARSLNPGPGGSGPADLLPGPDLLRPGRSGPAPVRHTAVAEYAFQRPLLTALGASIVVSIFARALASPRGSDRRRDQRDSDIRRHGEYIGFFVLAVGLLPAFALAMLEASYFWIANAIYLAYVLDALTSSVVKIIAYRRGL